jgi:hypothetical protein
MSESFEKGEQFEKFIEENVFLKEDFDLVHRTNSYEQNKNRYAEETMRPDLMFRDKKTGVEFYVEAKYRARFNQNDMIDVISQNQFVRFLQLQKDGCPITIVIGCGGKPSNPDTISLIPLDELKYLSIYRSVVKKYAISNIPIRKLDIDLKKSSPIIETKVETEVVTKTKKRTPVFIAAIMTVLLCLWFAFNTSNKSSIENQIQAKIGNYYKLLEGGSTDVLDQFIYKDVERWYSKINVSFEDVKDDFIRYRTKYPDSQAKVKWNTFKLEQIAEGRFRVEYELEYEIRANRTSKVKEYDLLITAIWGDDILLRSMYEERL